MSNNGITDLLNMNKNEFDIFVNNFISNSKKLKKHILKMKDNYESIMISLIRDTYIHNLLLRFCLFKSITTQDEFYSDRYTILLDYVSKYYSNVKVAKKFSKIHNYLLNNNSYDYLLFMNKIMTKIDDEYNTKKQKQKLNNLETKIYEIISAGVNINLNIHDFDKIKFNDLVDITQNKTNINISLIEYNYHKLLEKISNPSILEMIYNKYSSKTNNILKNIVKLILMRNELAKDLNFSTYYNYQNRNKENNNSDSIHNLINTLNKKLQATTKLEIHNIIKHYKREANITLLGDEVIDKIKQEYYSSHKFGIRDVLSKLFLIVNKTFGINFDMISNSPTIIEISLNGIKGRLLIQFDDNVELFSLRISDRMILTEDNISIPEVAFVCKDKNITYQEVIKLFMEFGDIIQNLLYDSIVGKINTDLEFDNLIPIIFEHLALDKDTIKIISSINSNNSNIIYDHITRIIDMTKSINIRKKLVSAKFDHILHNSEPLLLKMENLELEQQIKLFKDTYFLIYNEMFNFKNKRTPHNIDPLVISKIISNKNYQYSSVINEIFGYTCFYLVKYHNKIDEFNNIFFQKCDKSFGYMIKKFIGSNDPLDIYLTNVFGISDDIQSTYYDDDTEIPDNQRKNINIVDIDNDEIEIVKSNR